MIVGDVPSEVSLILAVDAEACSSLFHTAGVNVEPPEGAAVVRTSSTRTGTAPAPVAVLSNVTENEITVAATVVPVAIEQATFVVLAAKDVSPLVTVYWTAGISRPS